MILHLNDIIHIYNRGNNKQAIFFSDSNYAFFVEKINKHIVPKTDVLAYCLMPNHFHILVHLTETSIKPKRIGSLDSTEINNATRSLLSFYTAAINKQYGFTGSLFQQNTKYKSLLGTTGNYISTCFHYIHQNPVKAGLVKKLEDWDYSSFKEYIDPSMQGICNKQVAYELMDINSNNIYDLSYGMLKEEFVKNIF
jgi:putative transposase